MTASHRSASLLTVTFVSIALFLYGCAPSRPQAFRLSFLPATPEPVAYALEEPPSIESGLYANESPELLAHALTTPRPPEVDGRIVRADEHFEAGKRLYQQGDGAGARREFDLAMDILLSAPENLPDRQRLERKLDQITDSIYRYDLEGLGASAAQQSEVVYDQSPLDSIREMTFPTDPNLRPKVKEEIDATLSQLPLQENDAVLSYIHFFSTVRGRKTLIAGLRRAGRYRPLIQRILDEEGVPQELIYLAQIESGFLPRARSYKQAVGMWQFVQFRGREYGLNQSPSTDDRLDPEKATRAAARHLHDLYALFGDWYLAMAAYNCGPGCVERAVERTGFADFWELRNRRVLPRDTDNYVPLILALTIMAKNPKDYDLGAIEADQPVEYDSLDLDNPTNLALIADATDRPVLEIQDLNPALLKPVAPAGYRLRVPKGTSPEVLAALDLIPASHRASWRIHRVTNGETLAQIARRYATPAASLSAVNQRAAVADTLEAGELLVVPVSYPASRASVSHAAVAPHGKASHRAVRPHRAVLTASSRPSYKTASLAAKPASRSN